MVLGRDTFVHTHTQRERPGAFFSLQRRTVAPQQWIRDHNETGLAGSCLCVSLSLSLSLLWSLSLSLVATCNNKMVFLFWCVIFVTECAASSVEITNWLVPFRAGKNGWERISKPFQYRKKSGTLLQYTNLSRADS